MNARPSKALAPALLGAAGLALALVALRAPERTYAAPRREEPVTVPLELAGAPPAGCRERSFDVEGMCCAGCPPKLYRALSAVDGVEAVAVDPARGEVRAWVREDVPAERLAGALTFSQYTARARGE